MQIDSNNPIHENEYLRLALEASGIGTWRYNIVSHELFPDLKSCALMGQTVRSSFYIEDVLKCVHPEDTTALRTLFSSTEKDLSHTFRVIIESKIHWLYAKGERFSRKEYFGTVQDISKEMEDRVRLEESELKFRSIIEQAPIATCLFVGRELRIEVANDQMLGFWGRDKTVIGMPLAEALPELKGQPFLDLLDNVFTTGFMHSENEAEAKLLQNGKLGTFYFNYTYKPLRDAKGRVYAIMNMAIEVTDKVISERLMRRNETRFATVVEQSPVGIGLLKGKNMVIETGNDLIFELWGKNRESIGLPVMQALPELEGQGFIQLLEEVYLTGNPYHGYDTLARIEYGGVIEERYFDFSYSALKDENGDITGVLVMANDVTLRRNNTIRLAESEAKFRTVLNSAPAAMAVFKGKDMVIDVVNRAFLSVVDRDESIIGQKLTDAIPEIVGQKSIDLIQQVFATGKSVHSYARQVEIMRRGRLTSNFYNVSYSPILDINGNVEAVLDVAIDVTETIRAREAIEEAETALRGAIELAELGTWNLDPVSGAIKLSARMEDWFGVSNGDTTLEKVLEAIHPKDRYRVEQAVQDSIRSGKGYDEEYSIINQVTGRQRVLHAQGKTFYKPDGKPYLMAGTAQDITGHRQLQMTLSNEVKARTEELQRTLNDLEEANQRLLSSNEELAQYAYVASHDLQEPLRKISMFSKLLREKDEEGRFDMITGKIVQSSDRMSQLIRDLLEFSKLLKQDSGFDTANLNSIVFAVRSDFELLIEEKMAVVNIDILPEIECVPLQMNQLFYNLLSNALKFVKSDKDPEISIKCEVVGPTEAAAYLQAVNDTTYYRITVRDNGIGIDEKYSKQIFEVFKRLHGREEYSGSGIGLAICRRIVNNHKGAIYIDSTPGEGTAFHIIMPERQL